MKLSIVIPVYNEVNTLLEVLKRIEAVPFEKQIVIVDDGSTDGTREILQDLRNNNIQIVLNKQNRGKGFSIRKGFEYVNGDIVIIQDADLEYYPDEYPILIQKIIEGKADVVYGTRFFGAGRVFHFYHYLGNKLINFIANFLYDTTLSDFMTGYKVFRADVLGRLRLRANGFGIEAEITAQIFKQRLKVYEIPISYDGRDYDEGKKITWKDFFRSIYWLIRCKFESFDIGKDTLYRMRMMKNNNKWIFEEIKPYLGEKILEIGSGIGNISKFLLSPNKNLILTDINKSYFEYLQHRFIGNPKVKIVPLDILSHNLSDILPFKIDTIVCISVLEHIENDNLALDNIYKILEQNGRLIIIVPALKALYGSIDQKLGHFRRYDKNDLIKKLESKNFRVEKIWYHNFISTIGWFLNGRILKTKIISSFQVLLIDKFIPFFAKVENIVKIPFGVNIIAICKKPQQ
jgi:glycosyltransferase involved in cell wall biosynthesis